MNLTPELIQQVRQAVDRERLLQTATELVAIPSPTGDAGAVSDHLAARLAGEGFVVFRVEGGHPRAPAVIARLESGKPGRTLQFTGHLDVVHLPFVPPAVMDGNLTGSGSCDMKSGIAAAVEALRVLRQTGLLPGGAVQLVAHDLHEAPWGWGEQLNQLISEGLVGDAVLLPEPLCDRLPLVGRGAATWKVTLRRLGPPVHEVMRPLDQPSVITAGAELVARLDKLGDHLSGRSDPLAGTESVFIGQIHAGEIYNQYPQECWLEGTRRWLPGTAREAVEGDFRSLVEELARDTRTTATIQWRVIRDAFKLQESDPLVSAFQSSYQALMGSPLPTGPKPFVDDGNSFWGLRRIPAITHGPRAGGQHTVQEWVSIDDLIRVATLYALVACVYCASGEPGT
jgi:acetylornithine deacetylase/succinyl-diaminopimelate desuccinylase-like protein